MAKVGTKTNVFVFTKSCYGPYHVPWGTQAHRSRNSKNAGRLPCGGLLSAPMYKCKVFPYPIGSKRPEKVMPSAYEFIKSWQAECPGPHPYVLVKFFGKPLSKVYISPGLRHVDRKRYIPNIARRYRFLPCVKELLRESEETPILTRDGNLMLEGKAPTKERFRVVVGRGKIEDGRQTYRLVTFYPVTE